MTSTETLVAGRYRIIRALGAGGMGRVWLARDELLCRDVAIKEIVLPFGLPEAEREEMRLRTLREARAAARLSHPNVVQIYDVQSGDEQPWIVMEYVRSRSLLQVIDELGPLPVEQVAGIGLAVLSALDAANRVGVLHRDVKPSNVLIADDGRVVLTDFGSAMIDEGEGGLTRTGVILGSPLFIAPERVDRGVSSPEADLWSLGATLYAAVEGRPPYTRSTTYRSLVALSTDKPDPTRRAGPLKPVLNGLLQRNPQARMKPPEVEERLRRLADVQTTVHLRRVPQQRRPLPAAPSRVQLAPVPAPVPATPPADRPVDAQSIAARSIDEQPTAGQQVTGLQVAGAQTHGLQFDGQGANGHPVDGQRVAALPIDRQPVAVRSALGGNVRAAAQSMSPRRWRLVAAAVVAAVVVPLAAVAASADQGRWLPSLGDRNAGQAASAGPLVSADAAGPRSRAAAPSASESASAAAVLPSASSGPFVVPAGYQRFADRTGYLVAYPKKWSRDRETPEQMFFCAPGGPPTLRIRVWDGAGTNLVAALTREEKSAKLANYRRIRIEGPASGSAVWEYTFTDPKAGPLRAIEQAFVAGGVTYLVQWRTPPAKWEDGKRTHTMVMKSFRSA